MSDAGMQARGRHRSGRPGAALFCAVVLAITGILLCDSRAESGETSVDRLLATGQTTGYIGNMGDMADGNNDDGDLIRGRLPEYVRETGGSAETDNVVVDRSAGLMWVRDVSLVNGSGEPGSGGHTDLSQVVVWSDAVAAVEGLEYAGFDDWHVANFSELHTLADYGLQNPALDTSAFPDPMPKLTNRYVWTSTTDPTDSQQAYYINLIDGHGYLWPKDGRFIAWPVRALTVDDPVAVKRTGQDTRYHSGDDGDRRSGLSHDYSHFDDGVVDSAAENVLTDTVTSLVWIRDPNLIDGSGDVGGNIDLAGLLDWQAAIDGCNALEYGGRIDWRLPNIRELGSIVQPGRRGSALEPGAFVVDWTANDPLGHPAVWWSSTTSISEHSQQPPGRKAWFFTARTPTTLGNAGLDWVPAKNRPGIARCVHDALPVVVHPMYASEVRSFADFERVTVESSQGEVVRQGKFLLAEPGGIVPFESVFQDVSQFQLHIDFLRAAFPEQYATLTSRDYEALVAKRATRRMVAGGVRLFTTGGGARAYGFDVYIGSGDETELLTLEETASVHARLSRRFRRRPLVYSPVELGAVERALRWEDAPFPIDFPAAPPDPDYEAYTTGQAYGTVHLTTVGELLAGGASLLSRQHILVLDTAPTDLQGVVAGLVTGSRQGELSHLAIRLARRGTPNAHVADSHQALRQFEGQLVRLVVGNDGYLIDADVSLSEAEEWWSASRPSPVDVPVFDPSFAAIPDLAEIAANDAEGSAVTRVGAKAANLARLYRFVGPEHQVPGYAIPFGYYVQFMANNWILDDRASPPVERSLFDYAASLSDDARFRSDPVYRATILEGLRDEIRSAPWLPPGIEADLVARTDDVFGQGTMVRFRSSSNAEDGLRFNGAGLYDSTSVCSADTTDDDAVGPSHCDPGQRKERAVGRGLRKVWASLWNYRAWEEREYYGIDHDAASMAILVTPAFPDELANGVAFTGNPADPRANVLLVNAQAGDTSVVSPEPGVLPERVLLAVVDGAVTEIVRAQGSSIVPEGTQVLSDAQLLDLGAVLLSADDHVADFVPNGDSSGVMLDLEFKVRRDDGALIVKQIRPFLAQPETAERVLRPYVPADLRLCAAWRENEDLRSVLANKAVVALEPGIHTVILDKPDSNHSLLGDLMSGPELVPAVPMGPGEVEVTPNTSRPGFANVHLTRTYLESGSEVQVRVLLIDVPTTGFAVRRLDASAILGHDVVAMLRRDGETSSRGLQPCPLPGALAAQLHLRFESEQQAELLLQYGGPDDAGSAAPAVELTTADVALINGSSEVRGYERLVYTAGRHNWRERYWALFENPIGAAHGLGVYQNGDGHLVADYSAELLDSELNTLRSLEIVSVERRDVTATPPPGPGSSRVYLPAVSP